jgi:predicted DNA binding CopG/RHH family protein
MKMQKEHEGEKRTVMMRLRHMEAYCQNPTPPPTPVGPTTGRPSLDAILPERKVTDRDYHNLAQQYREREAMDTLHASKINVLRGKQKKAVENLVLKKEREIEKMEREQEEALEIVDRDFGQQEHNLRSALGAKRTRLEMRWRTQALIERAKMERLTGLKYGPLPDDMSRGSVGVQVVTASA